MLSCELVRLEERLEGDEGKAGGDFVAEVKVESKELSLCDKATWGGVEQERVKEVNDELFGVLDPLVRSSIQDSVDLSIWSFKLEFNYTPVFPHAQRCQEVCVATVRSKLLTRPRF